MLRLLHLPPQFHLQDVTDLGHGRARRIGSLEERSVLAKTGTMIAQETIRDASLYVMRIDYPKTEGNHTVIERIWIDSRITITAYDTMTEVVVDVHEIRDDELEAARPDR